MKTKRPHCVANLRDIAPERYADFGFAGISWDLGRATGTRRLGIDVTEIPPGKSASRFHCHSRKEEFFFVLSGRCRLRLGARTHELRAGDAVSRPAGTGVCHQFQNPYSKPCRVLMLGVQTGRGLSDRVERPEEGEILVIRADGSRKIMRHTPRAQRR